MSGIFDRLYLSIWIYVSACVGYVCLCESSCMYLSVYIYMCVYVCIGEAVCLSNKRAFQVSLFTGLVECRVYASQPNKRRIGERPWRWADERTDCLDGAVYR